MRDKNSPPFVPCTPQNSIQQAELEKFVALKVPLQIKIMELENGNFYAIVELKPGGESRHVYLVTRMKRYSPRIFKDLTRINNYLRESCPTSMVELHRNQVLPPMAEKSASTEK